jgi:hypothetical protein
MAHTAEQFYLNSLAAVACILILIINIKSQRLSTDLQSWWPVTLNIGLAKSKPRNRDECGG